MRRSLVVLAGSRMYRGCFAPSKSGRYLVQCDVRAQNCRGADSLSETFGPLLHVSYPGHRSNWYLYPECIWWRDVIDAVMERELVVCGFLFPSLSLFSLYRQRVGLAELPPPPMLVCLFYMYYIPVDARLTKNSKLTNHTLCGTLREGYV